MEVQPGNFFTAAATSELSVNSASGVAVLSATVKPGAYFQSAAPTSPGAVSVRRPSGNSSETGSVSAAAGVIAQRAATRGAWVAPANVPLRDVVALVDAAPPVEAIGVAARSMSQQSHIRIAREHYERAVEALASIAL